MAIFKSKMAILGPFWHLRDWKVLNNILKWMIPNSIAQLFAVDQMIKSKMAIFRSKVAIFGTLCHLRDWKVLNNILKWIIPDSISKLFAVDQMKIFFERSMAMAWKKAMDLSKNIFIWLAAKSCTMESGIIHFNTLINTVLSLKCQEGLKMATLCLKMAFLDLKMAMDLSINIFIWSTAKQLYYGAWNQPF